MDENIVLVSICCAVYNHEKYLRQCLDGFIMQKTSFEFEVLVHDDASTDHSADIIREYEEKYPKIIKPIYQEENQYSKGIRVSSTYLYPKAKGKYIALCEGDDFWIDDQKLQMQVNALEENSTRVFSMHRVSGANGNGIKNGMYFPPNNIASKEYDSDEFMRLLIGKNAIRFQTSSFLVKTEILQQLCEEKPEFYQKAKVGDLVIQMFSALHGKLYYIDKEMSVYRMFSENSYSVRNVCNEKKYIIVKQNFKEWFNLFDIYSKYKFHDCIKYEINKIKKDIFQLKSIIIKKEIRDLKGKNIRNYNLLMRKQISYFVFVLRGNSKKVLLNRIKDYCKSWFKIK